MALITYVDDHHKSRVWTILPPIAWMKTIHEYLSNPQVDDVLIIHGGQRDAEQIAESNRTYLIEAVVRVCERGGRAIIFSGGHPVDVENVRRELLRESFQEQHHYLLLMAISNLEDEIDMATLLRTSLTSAWPISEVKRKHATPTLLTLALLSQAALLAFEPDVVDHDAAELLGGREVMAELRAGCGATSGQRLLTPGVWRGAFGTADANSVQAAIEREWPPDVKFSRGLRELINALYAEAGVFRPDVLSRAFVELHGALERKQELQH